MSSPPFTNPLKQPGCNGSLQMIWDYLPSLIAFVDKDCRFIEANQSCCQWLGLSNNDLAGKHLAEVLTESNITQLNTILPQVWQGQIVTHALQVASNTGNQTVQVTCIPVSDKDDQIIGFYLSGTDNDQISVRQQLAFRDREQQLILDNLPDLVASFTSDFHYVWVNRSYLNFFGLQDQDQIRGKHVREIMGEEGWRRIQPYMQRVVTGERVVYDVEIASSTGLRYLQAVYIPNANELKQFVGFYALITDIYERKLTEIAFKKSEEKFRAIFNQDTIGVAQLDSTGKFIQINDRYCEIIGYSSEELQHKTIKSITHPEDFQQTLDQFSDLLSDRIENFSIENRYIKPDHTIVYVNLTVSRMVSSDVDASANLIAVAEDITQLKDAQKVMGRLAAIVESSDDAIMSKTLDGIITSWNKGAERLLGYTAEEAIGKPKSMLLPKDRSDEVRKNLAQIKDGEVIQNYETVHCHKNGLLIDVSLSVSPLHTPDGQLIGAATIARDISDRKSAAEQLKSTNDRLRMLSQQMQQAKETEQKRIAQELHDEFGQALSSLKWDLAYLKREIQRQPCLNDLDNINVRMEDMSTILAEAIETTRRIATALRPPMLDDLGLIPALEWLAYDFQKRTKISSTFCVDPSISPKSIQDDQATALFRITQELLTNVLRHAKASELTINLDWKDNHLVLYVKDNGVGYRAPPNPLGGSLGLLSIQERAESLGGLFSIQGLPEQGTTAIVQIPFSM